jgi:hypothetical protein
MNLTEALNSAELWAYEDGRNYYVFHRHARNNLDQITSKRNDNWKVTDERPTNFNDSPRDCFTVCPDINLDLGYPIWTEPHPSLKKIA